LKAGNLAGIISLIAFWLCLEFLNTNINILTPWLNLGNGLSKDVLFIQWYDVTGSSGGTLWILLSNILAASFIISSSIRKTKSYHLLLIWLLLILLPSIISVKRYFSIQQSNAAGEEVVIIQPNIDPYTEKFNVPFEYQLDKVISLAESAATTGTSWIVTPETTVDDPFSQDDLGHNKYVLKLRTLANHFPSATIVTGMVTYKKYLSEEIPSKSAVKNDNTGYYTDYFNSALCIDSSRDVGVYHKSKLVPGIEMQFAGSPARIFKKLLPGLGGSEWGFGTQQNRNCFINRVTGSSIAPVICYESIFGKFVSGYVKKGANALFIITNDGWWKGTNGYKQHLWYASLRAIETRRPVVRSANTGISCIIDIRGKRTTESEWWKAAALKGKITPETRVTFYVRHGDYILISGAAATLIILIVIFITMLLSKKIKLNRQSVQPGKNTVVF
jgi:apolipoprotein N-acyltransferase